MPVQGVSANPYQILQAQGLDQYTPSRSLAEFAGLMQNKLKNQRIAQKEDAEAKFAAAKRGAYSFDEAGNIDRGATVKKMAGIDPAAASEMQAKWQKQDADAQKAGVESKLKEHELVARTMIGVKDQAGYDRARQLLGDLSTKYNLPQSYDAGYVRQLGLSSLNAFQQMQLAQAAGNRQPPPAGYRYTADGRGLEPIPGGPAAIKAEDRAMQQATRQEFKARAGETVVQDIGRALTVIDENPNTVGPIASRVVGMVPGTAPDILQGHIDSIASNVGVDQLQAMREASPTGGALGQVTEKQQARLEGLLGNLKTTQDREVLKDNLKRISNLYNDIVHGKKGGPERFELSFDEQGRSIAKNKKKQLPSKLKSRFQNTANAAPAPAGTPSPNGPPPGQPLKVMQNGFEYIWNPQTGRYE